MITLYCTKKLEKFIGKSQMADPQLDISIDGWNTNTFFINRKRYIIAVHDQTCYAVVLPNILKKDMKSFATIFIKRLVEQLEFDHIPIAILPYDWRLDAPEVRFMPTNNNRKIIGTMTQFIKELQWYDFDETQIREMNRRLTNSLVSTMGDKRHDYDYPRELMHQYLMERRTGK